MTTPQDFGARAVGGYSAGTGDGDVAFLGANQLNSNLSSLERAVAANTKSIKDLTAKFAEYSKTAGGTHVKSQSGQGFAGVINTMTQYTGKHAGGGTAVGTTAGAGGYTPRHAGGQQQQPTGFPNVVNPMPKYTPAAATTAGPGITGAPAGGGGGGGTTAVMPTTGASGSGPPAAGTKLATFKGFATSAAFTAAGIAMGVGKAEFPNMLTMSNYIQQTTLGTSMSNQAANAMARRQLTGTAVGTSLQDVAAGQQMLQRMGGTVNLGSTPGSQAGVSTANALGYTNPGIGLTGAAQTTAAIYNPTAGIQATMMGLPSPFGGIGPNRKPQGITGFVNQLETSGRLSKQTNKPWTPEQVTAALSIGPAGVGGLYKTLSGPPYNLSPDQIGQIEQVAQAQAKLQQKGPQGQAPLNAQQAQALINKAAGGNKQAQQQLNQRGVNQTMQQVQQNLGQQQNQITGNMYNNFNQGLQTAAGLLTKFNEALEKIAGMPGVGQAAGFSGQIEHALGVGGGSGGLLGSLGQGAGMAAGGSLFKKLAGSKLGGKIGGKASGGILNKIGKGLGAGTAVVGAERLGMSLLPKAPKKAQTEFNKQVPKKGIGKDIYGVGEDIFGSGLNTAGGWLQDVKDQIGGLFAEGTHPMGHPAGRGGGAATPTSPKSKQDKPGKQKAKTANVSGAASNAVSTAEKYVGTPYVYGGDSPSAGFDCSGLVEFSYKQAGIALPRTSEAQWAFLQHKSVDLKKVQEGDIVFAAGSDGSAESPGHEALMISQRQIVEAPSTGQNIRIRSYSPGEWAHAGRPTGSLSGSSTQSGAGAVAGTGKAPNASGSGIGNTGTTISSVSPVGNYGSVEEIEGLTAALAGGGMGFIGVTGSSAAGTAGASADTSAAPAGSGKGTDKGGKSTGKYKGNYGTGVKQWSSQVTQALKQLGLSVNLLPLVLNQMQSESSGNPNAVNKTDSNWQAGHPSAGLMQVISCVPLSTQILTRRGWLSHNEVVAGDETIGFNPNTGMSQWTTILNVMHYDNAEVWRIGNSQWHVDVTPEHRWWSEPISIKTLDRSIVCPVCKTNWPTMRGMETHLGRKHKIRLPQIKVTGGRFATSRTMNHSDRLRLAASADTVRNIDLLPDEVRIIAWAIGDGHIYPDGRIQIYQSKPAMLAILRALLRDVSHSEYVRQRKAHHLPAWTFSLETSFSRELIKRSQLDTLGHEGFVLALDPAQRHAYLDAMIQAEGHTEDGFTRIAQVNGPVQDAIKLAVYLEGYRPTFSSNAAERNGYKPAGSVGLARPHVAVSMFNPHKVLAHQAVWCVETELGTWTMRQANGNPCLTGNSTFDAYAGPYKNKGPFLYGVSVDPLANIYAALNYAKHGAGFGTGSGQIGSMHGYAKGGKDTPEGMKIVGERGPELIKTKDKGISQQPIDFAKGGKDLTQGMKIVGERGPELIKTPKGSDILSNKQSMDLLHKSVKKPAETSHSTLLQDIAHGLKSVEKAAAGTLTQSQSANLASVTSAPSTVAYQNAARNLVLSTSTNVQRYGGGGGYGNAPMLNFKPNSIVIHNHSNSSGNGGASGDQQASLNAREMVKQVLKYLYNEQMYGAMVKGVKA